MWAKVAASLKEHAGIVVLKDLGCVYSGRYAKYDCTVSVNIETLEGAFYVCLMIDHRYGRTFRRIRGIKWPFSHSGAEDLSGVIADLERLIRARDGMGLDDTRGRFSRTVDRLTRRDYLGSLAFRSVIATTPEIRISADVERSGGQAIVSLWQYTRGMSSIFAHVPHEAFAAITGALRPVPSRRNDGHARPP